MAKKSAKSKPQKKIRPRISPEGHVQVALGKKRPVKSLERHANSWVAIGFDTSLSSLAGAAMGWDDVLKKFHGIGFSMLRWSKGDHYFDRLEMAAKSHEIVLGLLADLKMALPIDRIFIAQEEPFPPHLGFMARKGGGGAAMKQQAEISGAFLGGLLRYGYKQIFQIGNTDWRGMIRDQLIEDGKVTPDFTLHHSKWNDPKLCARYNCGPKEAGKFQAKRWAHDVYEPWTVQRFGGEIPDWPDLINRDGVKTPRPEGSKAKAQQPDDRYDALAMMEWMRAEIYRLGIARQD